MSDDDLVASGQRGAIRQHAPDMMADATIAALGQVYPWLGVAAALARPMVGDAMDRVLGIASRRRREGGEAVLALAFPAESESEEELAERLSGFIRSIEGSPKLTQLAVRAIEAGQSSYDERHIRALARALRQGALADDDARLDDELLIVNALSDMEAAHIRVLSRLAITARRSLTGVAKGRTNLVPGCEIPDADVAKAAGKGSMVCLEPILGLLERHGAIGREGIAAGRELAQAVNLAHTWAFSTLEGPVGRLERTWHVTRFGLRLLEYLDMMDGESAELSPGKIPGGIAARPGGGAGKASRGQDPGQALMNPSGRPLQRPQAPL